jgi:hypothetical protein
MRFKEKKVYYCDYCKKHSLSASTMSIHEKHCTMNPNRKCRLHEAMGESMENFPEILEKWRGIKREIDEETKREAKPEKEVLSDSYSVMEKDGVFIAYSYDFVERMNAKIHFEKIAADVDECPACILSIIRQAKLDEFPFETKFNYKKYLEDFWQDLNDRENDPGYPWYF